MLLLSVPVSSLYPAPDSVFTSKRRSPNSLYISSSVTKTKRTPAVCLLLLFFFSRLWS